jgi:lipoate-protein ligase A
MLKSVWHVEFDRGFADDFHRRQMPEGLSPSVWCFEVERSALVLGSSQPIEHVDLGACANLGVEVVRRHSGGGAVLVQPGDVLWVDVLIPVHHPMWTPDVTSSAWWLGEVWQRGLASLGMADLEVHRGPLLQSEWSSRVCFAGIGGGEVLSGERKVVGISQRRTRVGARFQCAVYRHWRPSIHADLLAAPGPTTADLVDLVATVDASFADVRRALIDVLAALD